MLPNHNMQQSHWSTANSHTFYYINNKRNEIIQITIKLYKKLVKDLEGQTDDTDHEIQLGQATVHVCFSSPEISQNHIRSTSDKEVCTIIIFRVHGHSRSLEGQFKVIINCPLAQLNLLDT